MRSLVQKIVSIVTSSSSKKTICLGKVGVLIFSVKVVVYNGYVILKAFDVHFVEHNGVVINSN
jgi:hypothetical protein